MTTFNSYKDHMIGADGSLYQCGVLVRRYATEAAAKRAADRRRTAQLAEWSTEHHQRVSAIVGA